MSTLAGVVYRGLVVLSALLSFLLMVAACGSGRVTRVEIEGDAEAARADGLLPETVGDIKEQYETYGGRLSPQVAGQPGEITGLVLDEQDRPLVRWTVVFDVRRAWGISCSTRQCEEFAKPIHTDQAVTDEAGRFAFVVPGDVIYEKARLFLYEVTVVSPEGKRRTFIYRHIANGETAFKELRL